MPEPNDESLVYKPPNPVIVFGDHTRVVKYVDFPFVCGADGTKVLGVKKDIYPKLAYFALQNLDIPTAGYSRHFKFLKESSFPIPKDYHHQKQIAHRLERADRLRRLRAYALRVGDSYLQGVFLEVFGSPETNPKGWDLTLIDDVVDETQYGTSNKSNQEGLGYPLIGMSNLTYSGRIDLQEYNFVEIPDEEFEDLKLSKGDVLFNRTNSTEMVGKTAVWKEDLDAVAASYLVKLSLKQGLNPDYFSQLLNMPYFKNLFIQRCKRAVSQSNVSPTLLKEFTIAVPPTELQNRFSAIVHKHERLRSMQVESLRQAELLYSTLLKQAFEGT